MQQKTHLVHAESVTKYGAWRDATAMIFDRMTATLPTDGICAVLGQSGSGRSTFLRLLNGAARPDSGDIITQTKFSVICNAGVFFHAALTGLENIKLAARLYGMDADLLTEFVLDLADFGNDWQLAAGALSGKSRKPMEMLVAACLPFDCYLLDDIERVDPDILILVLEVLKWRRVGIIFTAHNTKFARQFATFCGVLANHTMYTVE
jgi:ABC-type polysaccharide/polyol phosphate transport system ATPase subunit